MALKAKQKNALNAMKSGKNVFLSGEAGTGKSFVLNEFIKEKSNVVVCAPSGIAAINVGGVTIHRLFSVPISKFEVIRLPSTAISEKSALYQATCVIIDEISMCRRDLFEYVVSMMHLIEEQKLDTNEKLQQLLEEDEIDKEYFEKKYYKNTNPIQLIVVGDFFQLPPVVTDKDLESLRKRYKTSPSDNYFAFESPMWSECNFTTIVLDEVVRQNDTVFIQYLNEARKGNKACIPFFNEQCKAKSSVGAIYLCGTNRAVAQKNEEAVKKLKGKEHLFNARIAGDIKPTEYPVESSILLKIGTRIMTIINNNSEGYYNGQMGVVTAINDYNESIQIQLDNGKDVTITYNKWSVEDYVTKTKIENEKQVKYVVKEEVGSFSMLPIKLAYAISIHKSQGQTFDKVALNPYCWSHGQLYVALSRVKSLKGLSLTAPIKDEYLIADQNVIDFYAQAAQVENALNTSNKKIINEDDRSISFVNEEELINENISISTENISINTIKKEIVLPEFIENDIRLLNTSANIEFCKSYLLNDLKDALNYKMIDEDTYHKVCDQYIYGRSTF